MGAEALGQVTVDVVRQLRNEGVTHQVLLMRHSARHYSNDPRLEPFMGLTDEGKRAALAFGCGLGAELPVTPCSSYIGRCIETAYLLQRGSGCRADHFNTLEEALSPFYVKDFEQTVGLILKHDLTGFIRRWIDGAFSPEVMAPADHAASVMLKFAEGHLAGETPGLTVAVTHDWNLFAVKEFALKLSHETWGKVGYLEGVLLYRKEGRLMAVNHQSQPMAVDEALLASGEATAVHG
ncbi:histidine phosphatase family protein [Desulfoluna spongiiphila]|uniref:Broad specificity phosphatase PhoE n=1 Tax=Desulfoluna spongiiphila TaxID=419481 RepID=A0A1G5EMC5_9BACT|nr:histidine phosphatase family protein [Desulfoluna spongiiphila]SCY28129.1 Broad specificity phosphatase PhoE [Desulfoluna spongiiphila]